MIAHSFKLKISEVKDLEKEVSARLDASLRHYSFLDGWRGIAILAVVHHHLPMFFDMKPLWRVTGTVFYDISQIGYLGVDMFFVISGFLITGLFLPDLQGQIRVKRFYIRRFFKIIPQYSLLILSFLAFYYLQHPTMLRQAAEQFAIYHLFFQAYLGGFQTLYHTWSLTIEEHFYFFYPLLLSFVCFLHPNYRARRNLAALGCLGIIIACNWIRYSSPGPDFLSKLFRTDFYLCTTLYRIDAIAFGCLLRFVEVGLLERSSVVWNKRLAFVLSLVCFVVGVWIYRYLAVIDQTGFKWCKYTLAYLAPAFLFLSTYRKSWWSQLIVDNTCMRWIGKNSYAIYLWHFPLAHFFSFACLRFRCDKVPAFAGAYVIAVLLIGWFTTITIEKYFLTFRSRIAP